MKPVEYFSIGGYVFTIEDDASTVIKEYIDQLDAFYSRKESGSEVMEGIEERMAELLLEQCGRNGVVTLAMADSVIATLGKPEAIEEESRENPDCEEEPESKDEPQETGKVRRKLYRDPANGKVAGVCSGLGTFFGVDPTVFRLIFVILTLLGVFSTRSFHYIGTDVKVLSVPLVYGILWMCMPVARTVRQRDELRGEKGTVDAISARIRSSAQEIGETAGNVVSSPAWPRLWRVIESCIGIILLIVGVAAIVALGTIFISKDFASGSFVVNRIIEQIADHSPKTLDLLSYTPAVTALAIAVTFPFFGMIYGGVMMTFGLKEPKWHPGLWLFVIWLIALVVLGVLVAVRYLP